jgi:excisionase family DNA binding protein
MASWSLTRHPDVCPGYPQRVPAALRPATDARSGRRSQDAISRRRSAGREVVGEESLPGWRLHHPHALGAAHVPFRPLAVRSARDDVSPPGNWAAAALPEWSQHRLDGSVNQALGAAGHPVPPGHRRRRAACRTGCACRTSSSASRGVGGWPCRRAAARPAAAGRLPPGGVLGQHSLRRRHGPRRPARPSGRRGRDQPEHRRGAAVDRGSTCPWPSPARGSPAPLCGCSRRPPVSRYLTVEEVAESLSVSVSWVYKHKKLLGGVRLGDRLWRFPEQELMTRLSQPAVASTQATGEVDHGRQARPTPTRRSWRLG